MAITYAKEIINLTGVLGSYDVTKDGISMTVPKDDDNSDYLELMADVEAGELTITPAG